MSRTLVAATTLIGIAICMVGVPSSATGALAKSAGSQRLTYWGGFGAAANCDGSGIIQSPTTLPAPDFGFAIINADPGGVVSTTVGIRDIPNGYYTVRVIQGPDDCQTLDWSGYANSSGNVTIHLSEPGVSSTAFVAVDQWATFDGVPIAVNLSYVTDSARY